MIILRVFIGNMVILLVWWNRVCKLESIVEFFNIGFFEKEKFVFFFFEIGCLSLFVGRCCGSVLGCILYRVVYFVCIV